MLIGSINKVTPAFTTCVSPSSIFSSKVKPYWKPEQPPPLTNTRSLRWGFASSRISSPTLLAAESVKTRLGATGEVAKDSVDTRDSVDISSGNRALEELGQSLRQNHSTIEQPARGLPGSAPTPRVRCAA